jgi:hypothetical protein
MTSVTIIVVIAVSMMTADRLDVRRVRTIARVGTIGGKRPETVAGGMIIATIGVRDPQEIGAMTSGIAGTTGITMTAVMVGVMIDMNPAVTNLAIATTIESEEMIGAEVGTGISGRRAITMIVMTDVNGRRVDRRNGVNSRNTTRPGISRHKKTSGDLNHQRRQTWMLTN